MHLMKNSMNEAYFLFHNEELKGNGRTNDDTTRAQRRLDAHQFSFIPVFLPLRM